MNEPICEEGDTVLIRAQVARANAERVMVCIEHTHQGSDDLVPYTLVINRKSIAAVEVPQ